MQRGQEWSNVSRIEVQQADVQYPNSNRLIGCQAQALQYALVQPVLNVPTGVVTFRVVWRASKEARDQVWRSILAYRTQCDERIKTLPGVGFFVSAITGVTTRSPKPALPVVSPAISYWIVLKAGFIDDKLGREMIKNVQIYYQGQAEVKVLQEPPLVSSLAAMNVSLCTVMKDQANGYVRKKITECLSQSQGQREHGCPARIVVLQGDMSRIVTEAQIKLGQANIMVDMLIDLQ